MDSLASLKITINYVRPKERFEMKIVPGILINERIRFHLVDMYINVH